MSSVNKEIDIFELYRRTVGFVKRRWLMIVLIGVFGGAFGFVRSKLAGEMFQGNIVVSSELISKEDLYKKIFPLLRESGDLNSNYFANLLNVEPSMVVGVSNFNIDTSSLNNAFVIDFQHKDSVKIQEIALVFSDFYNQQKDFQLELELADISTRKYLELIDEELKDLNEFQKKVLDNTSASDVVFMNMSGSSKEIVELYEKKLKLEQQLELESVVTVTSNDAYKIEKGSFLKSVILWGIVFSFLGFILALFFELDREARKVSIK